MTLVSRTARIMNRVLAAFVPCLARRGDLRLNLIRRKLIHAGPHGVIP
jgi:hypothetical protein